MTNGIHDSEIACGSPSRRITLGWVLAIGLTLTTSALAIDGVVEINHTCAVRTGCFPGDLAGYPVTIDGRSGRSFRLTSDLIVPDENTHGIYITRNYVSIDLNEFMIARDGCESTSVNCVPASGTGRGIMRHNTVPPYGTMVKDGSVVGMGGIGVYLGPEAKVSNLRVRWTRGAGIAVGAGSTVSESAVYECAGDGIHAGVGSLVAGNTIYQNGINGITASHGSTVSGNVVYQNGNFGIDAGTGSTVSANTVFANGDDGIHATSGANVQRNSVRDNNGYGMLLGNGTAYRENVITDNSGGTILGSSAVNMGNNSCNGTASCP